MAKINENQASSVLNKIIKKCKLVIKILILIFTFYLIANYITNSSREAYFYNELAKKYKNNEQKFFLKDLTNFKWDNVKAYTPYSPSEEETYLKFYRYGIKVATIKGRQDVFQEKVTGKEYSYIWFFDKRFEKFGASEFLKRDSEVNTLDYTLNEFIGSGGPDYKNEKFFDIGNNESIFVETGHGESYSSKFYYFQINN